MSFNEAVIAQADGDVQRGQAQADQRQVRAWASGWCKRWDLADAISLSGRACERIAKAGRLTTQLPATLAIFSATIQEKLKALGLSPEIETLVHQQPIPAIYLERVAARSTRAERRHALHQRLRESRLDAELRSKVETVAAECADLSQCSSSCAEGRNGQLSLYPPPWQALPEQP